ncbi:glutamate--cysteine ligase [Streptomyces sp. TRM 70351]|uniref:carboxylate-amine ligase n=1 Tax=Streptomyces sp. TRM 70351 TaxID=3116552 RepID=UPI002E7B55AB|nr:glutamate--cysteine ligase [Streptomyces sp. TRM 70351]MEE1930762.1 glutamate--cysteine ligase [Streptomyces sp. TRM 70351]
MTRDATADGWTMGVEEEFLLADPASGGPAPGADAVLRRAAREPAPDAGPGTGVKAELCTTQVEAASGVCTTLDALHADLAASRARLAGAARELGLALLACGSPALPGERPRLTPGERFTRVAGLYADVAGDYQVCGCHVHVGVADRDTAVAVTGHLHPWLPSLLALSANSPLAEGRDRGFASWRMMEQARFPGSGAAPQFPDAAAHDAAVRSLVDAGVLVDDRMTFWLARPSPWLPTVEFRIADTVPTAAEAVLQAALSRALVRRALADIAAGRPQPPLDPQLSSACVWSAARYGLAGDGVDPFTGRRTPATALLQALLDHVAPHLAETGDAPTVQRLLKAVLAHGTGAERQRRAFRRGGPAAVAAYLAAQTEAKGPDTP